MRPRKQVESWIPALQLATYWLEEEKNCKDFSKHQHFIYVYLTRSLSQLILGITFFFLSGFYFRSIHYSQESRERERVFVLNSSLPLHKHLEISRAITAVSSPLHIARDYLKLL